MTRGSARVAGLCAALLASCLSVLAPHAALAEQSESQPRAVHQGQIATGYAHTCALFPTGSVRCWGQGSFGQLGYADTADIGDDETPSSVGDVPLGGRAVAIAAGDYHTCALLEGGGVRCWGDGTHGRLGYGDTNTVGDDETPASVGDVPLGGPAKAITAGGRHTCALLATGAVRCWGWNASGQLGYGNTADVGDGETPASVGDVDLGGSAIAISAGGSHTCALLETGAVRCWGSGANGRLGYGNTISIGDDESPASAGDVPLGDRAVALSAGMAHTCAVLATGAVRCWGRNDDGRLGYGDAFDIGAGKTPASAGDVPLGGTAVAISAGGFHTCAVLSAGAVRCWGRGVDGAPGYGNAANIGDDETPASVGDVVVGGTSVAVSAGFASTCVVLSTGTLRCWGDGADGRLGHANTSRIGDDETPASVGDVPVGGTLARLRSDVSLAWSSPGALTLGASSTVTLTASESGPSDATDVVVVVRVPGVVGLGGVAASRGRYDASTGIWRIPVLHGSATLTMSFTAAQPGLGSFDAWAVTTSVDPDQADPGTFFAARRSTPIGVGLPQQTGAPGPPGVQAPAATPVLAAMSRAKLRSAPRSKVRLAYLATTTTPLTLRVVRGKHQVKRLVVKPRRPGRNSFVLVAPKRVGTYRLRLMHDTTLLDRGRLVVKRARR